VSRLKQTLIIIDQILVGMFSGREPRLKRGGGGETNNIPAAIPNVVAFQVQGGIEERLLGRIHHPPTYLPACGPHR